MKKIIFISILLTLFFGSTQTAMAIPRKCNNLIYDISFTDENTSLAEEDLDNLSVDLYADKSSSSIISKRINNFEICSDNEYDDNDTYYEQEDYSTETNPFGESGQKMMSISKFEKNLQEYEKYYWNEYKRAMEENVVIDVDIRKEISFDLFIESSEDNESNISL
mgnify:FL=1